MDLRNETSMDVLSDESRLLEAPKTLRRSSAEVRVRVPSSAIFELNCPSVTTCDSALVVGRIVEGWRAHRLETTEGRLVAKRCLGSSFAKLQDRTVGAESIPSPQSTWQTSVQRLVVVYTMFHVSTCLALTSVVLTIWSLRVRGRRARIRLRVVLFVAILPLRVVEIHREGSREGGRVSEQASSARAQDSPSTSSRVSQDGRGVG
jgi:hypothetical protein